MITAFIEHQFLQMMGNAFPTPTPHSSYFHRGAGSSRPQEETSRRASGCLHTPSLTSPCSGPQATRSLSSGATVSPTGPLLYKSPSSQVGISSVPAPGVCGDCPSCTLCSHPWVRQHEAVIQMKHASSMYPTLPPPPAGGILQSSGRRHLGSPGVGGTATYLSHVLY